MKAVSYKRAMAPLDAKARARLWESGGANAAVGAVDGGTVELEDLVHAFYNDEAIYGIAVERAKEEPALTWMRDLKAVLKDAEAAEPLVEWIRVKAEAAIRSDGLESLELVRRKLTRRMHKWGLDAGICESRRDHTAGIPASSHEYIDVVFRKRRFIVEINLAEEFEIARPTTDYLKLLSSLPAVFVGTPATLEAVIQLMCSAAEESIKSAGMHVPPWRRQKYMREKWFGDYRRARSSFSSGLKGRVAFAGQPVCRAVSAGT